MDLATALAQTETRKGPQCSVCKLLAEPPKGVDAGELRDALSSNLEHNHLARALAVLTGEPRWANRGATIRAHRSTHS
jgi:hypothetical protein